MIEIFFKSYEQFCFWYSEVSPSWMYSSVSNNSEVWPKYKNTWKYWRLNKGRQTLKENQNLQEGTERNEFSFILAVSLKVS